MQQPGADPVSRLPHGPSFRFLTRIVELRPGAFGEGVWTVSGTEEMFAGHFPGDPVVPGVLIVESMAQLAGLVGFDLGEDASTRRVVLSHVNVKFLAAVRPPADIHLRARLERRLGSLQLFDVSARIGEAAIATGVLALATEHP